MTFKLTIPEINQTSTKDIIIAVLARDWPQTNKQIYHKIKKRTRKKLTFQAVYKSLQELVKDKVLVKNNKNYQLSFDWINSLAEFSKRLQFYQYEKKPDIRRLFFTPNEYVYVLTFNNVKEADKCFFSTEKQFFIKRAYDKRPIIIQTKHNWWSFIYGKTTLEHFNLVEKVDNDFYMVFQGDTVLDRWNARFYKNLGAFVKTGAPCAENYLTFVYGDTIAQVYFPYELSREISSIFNETKNIEDLNIPKFIKEIMEKPYEIKALFFVNNTLADSIRKNVLDRFSENI